MFAAIGAGIVALAFAIVGLAVLQRTSTPLGPASVVAARVVSTVPVAGKALIHDGGFETVGSGGEWQPYERGFEIDRSVFHGGHQSIRCRNTSPGEQRGARCEIVLNQTAAAPLLVAGWSRADGVDGTANNDYSVYVDLVLQDGTNLWGQTAPFATGTHAWERKQVLIAPSKPIRSATVYALFRGHAGTAWFDDISATEVAGSGIFDSQPMPAPLLAAGLSAGWYGRDVRKGGPPVMLADAVGARPSAASIGLKWEPVHGPGPGTRCVVTDLTGRPRALTLYYVERLDARGGRWGSDLLTEVPIARSGTYGNFVRVPGEGATGTLSRYPFGSVSKGSVGRSLGIPPDLSPKVARIGYDAGARLLFAAFDVALTGDCSAWRDARGHGRARVGVVSYKIDPAIGFRSALNEYRRLFPAAFERRARKEGIWIPFTAPSKVSQPSDFSFAYHEGDSSIPDDRRRGILSFRYTEPMTYWMPMATSVPRTYAAAIGQLRSMAKGRDSPARRSAQAVLNSGAMDERGQFRYRFRNEPWAKGAVWVLNPNPAMPCPPGEWTKARINAPPATGGAVPDGEYLDSLEGWADELDFRPASIRASPDPPTFDRETLRPVVPTWFSVYAYTRWLSVDLHRRGRLLFANSVPVRFWAFAPLLDVMGIETDWGPGRGSPDSEETFAMRRTLSGTKPYLLLQNTDFDRFGSDLVRQYFERCLFWAVYPSFFSANAADSPYWENPRWYERDRPLFRQYLPILRQLSAAGWAAIPHARAMAGGRRLPVERYGRRFLTLRNPGPEPAAVSLSVDPGVFSPAAPVTELVTNQRIDRSGDSWNLEIPPGATRVLRFGP